MHDEQQGTAQGVRWYTADPAALDQLTPDGESEQPHDASWTIDPEGKWILGNHPESTPEQRQRLRAVLAKHQHSSFAYSLKDLVPYTGPLGPARFELKEDKAMWQPQRQYTVDELAVGDEKVGEMLEAHIISEVPTTNRHASAITLPMKRAPDGSWTDKRFCIDLRHVNSNTVVDKYGLPLPEQLFQRMRGCRFMTKLDMRSGFFAVALDEESKLQTAFWWRGKLYAFNRLPFGHVNATAIFQRRMELELQQAGLTHCTSVFVDDVCIFSDSMEDHIQQLDKLLAHFAKANLRAHPSKTIVAVDCLPYLGHLVTASELKPDPAKVAAMHALQPPTNVKRLQSHLGLFNYYRCYIREFSRVAAPLTALTKKDAVWKWGTEEQEAYDQLKAALTVPGLALKQPDPSLPYRLYTDWSCTGIAALLNQVHPDGSEHLVACVSRTLNPAERNYAAWKGELLAAVYGIKAFRPYLLGQQFQLITDHRALLWLLTHKHPVGQQARWLLSLSEYQFSLVHRAGIDNPADAPSREPLACMADWTGSRLDSGEESWTLPQVFLADGSLDPVNYSHDQLALELGLQPCSAAVTIAAAALSASPARVLADEAQLRPPSHEEATSSLLFALSAISASSDDPLTEFDPLAPQMGGGYRCLFFERQWCTSMAPCCLKADGWYMGKPSPGRQAMPDPILHASEHRYACAAHSVGGSNFLSGSTACRRSPV